MTGMDVMRRCGSYVRDMERLRMMLAMTRDAMTRITRSPDTQGGGGGAGDDRLCALTARIDELERGIAAREETHDMEIVEALRLVGGIDNPEIASVLYGKYVSGDTYAVIAHAQRTSEAAVRGARRRGAELLQRMPSRIKGQRYAELRRTEEQALHPHSPLDWPQP